MKLKREVHACYKVAEQSAKKGEPFVSSEFIKSLMLANVEVLWLEKIKLLHDIRR